MAGQVCGLVKEIKPIKAVLEEMVTKADEVMNNLR